MKQIFNSNKKIICTIIFIFTLLILGNLNTIYAGYISDNINEINDSQYPGYKQLIEALKSEYPTWNFKLYYTELDWDEVIINECQGHGTSPKSLSPANNSRYDGQWICPYCKRDVYDSEDWYCASEIAISYMMDPRNSINSSDIFQFQDLSSKNIKRENIEKMVEGTFLDDDSCVDAIMTASKKYSVNGYYLVARIFQEQGRSGSYLSLGEGYNGEYIGVYNLFNIGAYGNGESTVIMNGLEYADSQGWHSKADSIIGGSEYVAKSYISIGQNTLYFQKFNVVTDNLYNHQYMQNILAAQNEGTILRQTYSEFDSNFSSDYTFLIPLYENMPEDKSIRPITDEFEEAKTIEATVNANGGLKLKDAPSIHAKVIIVIKENSKVRIAIKATKKIDGYYWDKVLTEEGNYGYVARESQDGSKKYLILENEEISIPLQSIQLNKKEINMKVGQSTVLSCTYNPENTTDNRKIIWSSDNAQIVNVDSEGRITAKSKGTATITAITTQGKKATCKITVTQKDEQINSYSAGDVNGDEVINTQDAMIVLRYTIGLEILNKNQINSADVNKSGKVDTKDAISILRYTIGLKDF